MAGNDECNKKGKNKNLNNLTINAYLHITGTYILHFTVLST